MAEQPLLTETSYAVPPPAEWGEASPAADYSHSRVGRLGRIGLGVMVAVGLLGPATACSAEAGPSANGSTEATASPWPTPTSPAATEATPTPTPEVTPTHVKPKVSKRVLSYFYQVALQSEYGKRDPVVVKWTKPIVTVHADGSISKASRQCLNRVITDFNALTTETDLQLNNEPGYSDVTMHFAPVSKFASLDPNYKPVNYGYFTVNWGPNYSIFGANILISTTGVTDTERCHLIREELTQSTGLMQDTSQYPSSIFYGPWTRTTRYSSEDKQLIALLYGDAGLVPGDTRAGVAHKVTAV